MVQGENAEVKLSTLTYNAEIETYGITVPEGFYCPSQAAPGQSVSVTANEFIVPGSVIVYDPTTDAKVPGIATSNGYTFTMPSHAVEVTGLQHPDNGQTVIATIAATTAGVGSAFARNDHPDVWTVDVPAEPLFRKAVFVHPYKTHGYNRTNLTLVCPDGVKIDINAIYDKPWDVSGHILPGQRNTFTITNERTAGIDYWANGIATKASYLTRLELSEPENVAIDVPKMDQKGQEPQFFYDLQGRRVIPSRPGVYITNRRTIYLRE